MFSKQTYNGSIVWAAKLAKGIGRAGGGEVDCADVVFYSDGSASKRFGVGILQMLAYQVGNMSFDCIPSLSKDDSSAVLEPLSLETKALERDVADWEKNLRAT
jgi:hypothetical protein